MNVIYSSDFGWGACIFLIMGFILYKGVWQFFANKRRGEKSISLVPLGAIGLIIGLIAYFQSMQNAFDPIAEAGDISPALVASSISSSQHYPIVGLCALALSYLFKYINQVI